MRWSVHLPSPDLTASGGRLALGPDPAGRRAEVTVNAGDGLLTVCAVARWDTPPGTRPDHEEWYNRAHLQVMLNPGHDHGARWSYAVDDRQVVEGTAHYAAMGEEAADEGLVRLDDPPAAAGSFGWAEQDEFRVELRIPAGGLWPDGNLPVGFAVGVGFHEAVVPEPLVWPAPHAWAGDTPLGFGDLYRQPPAVTVASFDAHEPFWGGASSEIRLRGRVSDGGPAGGRLGGRIELPGDGWQDLPEVPWTRDGDRLEARMPVVFPFRAKWANGLAHIARLHLWMCDPEGRRLWQAAYPFGFDHGLIVRERFGPSAGPPAPRPEPSSDGFPDAFRRYILTRIPDYRMRTTREGAPSDFYLEDPEGQSSVDLSAESALDDVGDMLAGQFPDWQDALCAVAMWVHHPLVTRHSSAWSRVSNRATVDTVPRLAGCFCGDTTRLTAALAERIGHRAGVGLRGYAMGLRGHLATLVETPIGRVVVDGMLGLWFHTLDNERLATLEEMRACRAIAERAWYAPRAHGHEFFFGVDNQLIRPWQAGSLRWPEAQR